MRCKIWCIQTTDQGTKEVKNCEGELSVLALHTLHGTFSGTFDCVDFLRKTIDTTSFESLPESGVYWGFEKFASELLGSYSSLTNYH